LKDKEELLEAIDEVIAPKKHLDGKYLLVTYLAVAFVVALAFFKIYVHQQIYYESRKIAKLRSERDLLKEENRVIKSSVEAIRFKNQIADTMFEE
jgi:cell division protein FtsL